jgi:hypothetical protein
MEMKWMRNETIEETRERVKKRRWRVEERGTIKI